MVDVANDREIADQISSNANLRRLGGHDLSRLLAGPRREVRFQKILEFVDFLLP